MEINANNVYINCPEIPVKSFRNIRSTSAVATTKKNVRNRDKVCMCCGEADKILQVHHIFKVSEYPELASNEHNCILLCQKCHDLYHNQYDGAEGADTFAKYLRDNGRLM